MWNTQALFATDPAKHRDRSRVIHKLMASHDIGCWSETHGAEDRCKGWRNPPNCRSWWSPGPSAATAGVGITAKNDFLALFERVKFEIIFPGRAAVLRLTGVLGSLDIYSVYFPTGDSSHAEDMLEAGYDPSVRVVSNFELREALRRRLASRMRPRDQTMSVIAGDFNFVTFPTDRICASSSTATGQRDYRDVAQWRKVLELPFGFHDLYQPEPTYASPDSRSRIDRIYSNQHDTEFLDKTFTCTALHWNPALSRHRPLSFRKSVSETRGGMTRPIPDQVLDHPDWSFQVSHAYHTLLRNHPTTSSLGKLQKLKEAMRIAERALTTPVGETPPAMNLEDRLGTAMRFLRASEAGVPERISSCLKRYPLLSELVHNPYDFASPPGPRLSRIRRHIMELQRDFTMQELGALHDDLRDLDPLQAARRRRRNQRLVCRLAPGRSCQQFAIDTSSGDATTDPQEMLNLVRVHWSKVFRQREVNAELTAKWLREDAQNLPGDYQNHLPNATVPITTFHKAILSTQNSAPGRDGIPFKAWRKVVDLAAGIFESAYQEMIAPDGLDRMRAEWSSFNESLMVFLPKKASSTLADGTEVFSPSSFRPLAITNTDNRILSSAVRLHIEHIVAPGISAEQRGFVKDRSMLANVLDIEEAMVDAALNQEEPLAVFLDFEAAFPSLNQDFIQQVLKARDWPMWMRRFVAVLYDNNFCELSISGITGTGFKVTAGVRQGCPLSPLIFSVISDVLLRRLHRLAPGVLVRAYADDIALVLRRLFEARMLEDIFGEYEFVSGLKLHPSKSVVVPLSLRSHDEIRTDIAAVAHAWGSFCIAGCTKYLGFLLGPSRGSHAWDSAIRKMHERAKVWKGIGAGMLVSIAALKMYIYPLAGFLVQLEQLPPDWKREEQRIVNTLFPGTPGWTSPSLMQNLRSLGFPGELPSLDAMALGAKCRVHNWEDRKDGGLQIRRRLRRLTATANITEFPLRAAHWRSWLTGNFFAFLQQAHDKLSDMAADRGISIEALLQGTDEVPVPKNKWQKRCTILFSRPDPRCLDRHLRRRLDRWTIPALPGHRIRRLQSALRRLGPLVPPCVWAATLKAMMDGWTSKDRARPAAFCCFGCQESSDTIAHYARCVEVKRLTSTTLRLAEPCFEDKLEDFLLLRKSLGDTQLAMGALRVYATFIATNAVRNGRAAQASGAWKQAIAEAAGRPSPMSKMYIAIWSHAAS